jgi:hypothetical protein
VKTGFCDVVAEPSATGRDAAGRLSRKTGEVKNDRASNADTLAHLNIARRTPR